MTSSHSNSDRTHRILLSAYACHPFESMETRVGWRRAIATARHYPTWVLHGQPESDGTKLRQWASDCGVAENLTFVRVQHDWLAGKLLRSANLFWSGYRSWLWHAYRHAVALHEEIQFSLAHQVNFCCYREPGQLWRLGIPFIIGPVGGTPNLPYRFLRSCDLTGATWELSRSALNNLELSLWRRSRSAFRSAAEVLAANSKNAVDLQHAFHVRPAVRLETGIDQAAIGSPRPLRNPQEPLKILWSGRLETWKGFPLLIEALKRQSADIDYRVKVAGAGRLRAQWQQAVVAAGLADRIEWCGWPSYDETLAIYRWADIFTFTSLRDTSGTGLLESLAAGTPIVGLNHQGAADIMSVDSCYPIAVQSPRQVTSDLSAAIAKLAREPQLLKMLSDGALKRASRFTWEDLESYFVQVYERAIEQSKAANQTKDPVSPGVSTPTTPTASPSARRKLDKSGTAPAAS